MTSMKVGAMPKRKILEWLIETGVEAVLPDANAGQAVVSLDARVCYSLHQALLGGGPPWKSITIRIRDIPGRNLRARSASSSLASCWRSAPSRSPRFFTVRHEGRTGARRVSRRGALQSGDRDVHRESQQPCIAERARLQQIGEVFRRHAEGEPLGLKAPVARPAVLVGGSTGTTRTSASPAKRLGTCRKRKSSPSATRSRPTESTTICATKRMPTGAGLRCSITRTSWTPYDWSHLRETWGDLIGMSNRIHSIGGDMLQKSCGTAWATKPGKTSRATSSSLVDLPLNSLPRSR